MKFGVPWSAKGIRPEARETAKEAARRAGVTLDDWLSSVILQQAAQTGGSPEAQGNLREGQLDRHELAAVNMRLDDLTHRLDQITRIGVAAYAPKNRGHEADQRAELIGRLDQYLSAARDQGLQPRSAAIQPLPQVDIPPALNRALTEIAARQRSLNGEAAREPSGSRPQPDASQSQEAHTARSIPALEPERGPQSPQGLSVLEEQLRKLTDQIETLRRPGVEEAINALRAELREIGKALDEAMPRRALDSIERQVQEISKRIDEGRQNGADHNALAGIEHGLGEVHDALRHLMPAENLIGFNDAIEGLAQKIDLIVAEKDPATMAQLESAITTLREMVNHVASNDAVNALSGQVQSLAEKVDNVARGSTSADALSNLERRIDALADALSQRRESDNTAPPRLEALVQSLVQKVEQIQETSSGAAPSGHLEEHVAALVQRLDASDSRFGQLEAVERGLAELLAHLQQLQSNHDAAVATAAIAPAPDSFAVDALRYDLAQAHDALKNDLVRSQEDIKGEIARTHGALDQLHGTLGQLLDRLATIEKNVGNERSARAGVLELTEIEDRLRVRRVDDALPSQASRQTPMPAEEQREPVAAVGGGGAPWSRPALHLPPAPQFQGGRSETLPFDTSKLSTFETQAKSPPPVRFRRGEPVNPDFPPDQPLEPGSGPPPLRANPAARIAASQAALGDTVPSAPAGGGKEDFIAAARRAAQAALQQEQAGRSAPGGSPGDGTASLRGRVMKRMKSLFIAASIVALVVGSVQIAGSRLHYWGKPSAPHATDGKKAAAAASPTKLPPLALASPTSITAGPPVSLAPSAAIDLFAPTAEAIASADAPAPDVQSAGQANAKQQTAAAAVPGDVTGSLPAAAVTAALPAGKAASTPDDSLPVAIGSERLRKAAIAGDGAAAYEIAVRFAEGRGVPVNLTEAARWYERAADQGLVPAQFRYASLLEKGQGVKKDLVHARQLYFAAAKQGNAKAMHNLAVLYAEGVDGKPDYKTAAQWFLKAAKHDVSDSQYNLGILCARGIGVEKNLVDSYKWFALAARHGDKEAAKKRDEVASHLDAKELAAAKRAVEHFKAEPQPRQAIVVPMPSGGWGAAAASAQGAGAPAPRPVTVGKR